jgi:hypothetical protein
MGVMGCSIKKPEAPTWETTWDMPLTNKAYSIEDIVDKLDSDEIVFDSLGNPSFSINETVDTVAVEDNLTADAVNHVYDDSIGIVDIDEPSVLPTNIAFADLNLPVVTDEVPIDTSFLHSDTLSTMSNFDWAIIDEGVINFQVTNDLGVDIDSLAIILYNSSDLGTPLGVAIFESGILDGAVETSQLDLAGVQIENRLTISSYGIVLAQTIDLPSEHLVINSTFPLGLSVSSAYAEVPAFDKDFDQTIDMTDESVVYEALIDEGSISIQIVNGSTLPMNISLVIPGFENGSTQLTINEYLTGNNSLSRNIDLAGYTFTPSGSTAPQNIVVNVQASIPSTAPSKYLVNSPDSVKVIADVSEITFTSVLGQIEPTDVDIDPMIQEVDMPEGFEDAQLTQAQLRMTLYNNSLADMYVNILLENEDQSKNVAVTDTVRGKTSLVAEARQTDILVSELTLSDFLDPTPSEIRVTGVATLNPAGLDSVIIHKDDFFYGDIEIYSPLAFALSDTSEMDLEITDAEIAGDDTPDFQETFDYGLIHAELASHLPVGAIVQLYIGTTDGDGIYTAPNTIVVGPFFLESATTDANGFAIEEIQSVFNDSLTSTEIAIFDNEIVYIAPKVSLLPTGAAGSVIQGSDYINIKASARVQVNAGEHLWEDDDEN